MNAFPGSKRAAQIRRLKRLWHAVLPGAVVAFMIAFYTLVHLAEFAPPPAAEPLAAWIPGIVGGALLLALAFATFIKRRLPVLVARNTAPTAVQRVTAAMFILLSALDAPALVGLAFFAMSPADWLAAAVVLYAFAAGVVFKPDFGTLLECAERATNQTSV